jgi:hypothetical protein
MSMPFDVHSRVEGGILRLKVSGPTTFSHMQDLADHIDRLAVRHKRRSILLECGGMTGGMPLSELYEIGQLYGRLIARAGLKLAAIDTPPHWTDNRFSENVVHNQGGRLEHFPSFEEAESL